MYVDSSGRLFVPTVSIDISDALRSTPTHEILNVVKKKLTEVRVEVEMDKRNVSLNGLSAATEGPLFLGVIESPNSILSCKTACNKRPMLPSVLLTFEEKALLRDFLISCCEPACRTHHMNEYVITPSSLSAASAEGMYSMDDVGYIIQYYGFSPKGGDNDGYSQFPPVPAPIQEMLHTQISTSRLRLLLRRRIGSNTPDVVYYLYCPSKGYLESIIIGGKIRHLFNCVAVEPGQPPQLILSDYEVGLGVSSMTSLPPSTNRPSEQSEPGDSTLNNDVNKERVATPNLSMSVIPEKRDFETIRNYLINRRLYRSTNASTKSTTKTTLSKATAIPMVYCAEVKPNRLRDLKRCLSEKFGISVDCYYDFQSDTDAKNVLNFTLKDGVKLRPYQEASLERFCQAIGGTENDEPGSVIAVIQATRSVGDESNCNDNTANLQQKRNIINDKKRFIAHHGIVVLPCGAGKTLTGISASAMVGKRTIVLCVNVLSVLQWRDQFLKWTNLKPSQITICTKDVKDVPGDIFITTYTMLTVERNTSNMTVQSTNKRKEIFDEIEGTTWGMLLLDEVHMAPANHFQTVVDKVKHKCILGLTATLLREDLKVEDLRFLVGPKLYEANWLELTQAGHLANVTCAEIRCPLPPQLLKEYLTVSRINEKNYMENNDDDDNIANSTIGKVLAGGKRARKTDSDSDGDDDLENFYGHSASKWYQRFDTKEHQEKSGRAILTDIECINPYKLWCTQALIAFHESRSPPDKVIVFCDSCPAARYYAHKLGLPFMYGITSSEERSNILRHFVHSKTLHTIILSRVGDIALDLPEATVIIQVSGLFSSKRQEAQRLGRILRPKPPALDHGTSFFYSLVSQDTDEVKHLSNRQIWLRNQGYFYLSLSYHCIMKEYCKLRQKAFMSYREAERDRKGTQGGLLSWWDHALGHGAVKKMSLIDKSLPLLRPLVCIGPPVWYYVIPVIQCFVEIFHKSDCKAPSSSIRDIEHDPFSIRALNTSLGAQWTSFSAGNAIELEKRFLGGHHRYLTAKQRTKYENKKISNKENFKDLQFTPLCLPNREALPLYVDIHMTIKEESNSLANTGKVKSDYGISCDHTPIRLTATALGPFLCTILFDSHRIPESNGRLSFKPEPHKQIGNPLIPPKDIISLPMLLSALFTPSTFPGPEDALWGSQQAIIDTITKGVRDCYETEYARVVQGGCIGGSKMWGYGTQHYTPAVEAAAPFSIKRGHVILEDGNPVPTCYSSSSIPSTHSTHTTVLDSQHRCVEDLLGESECINSSLVSSDCIQHLLGLIGKR